MHSYVSVDVRALLVVVVVVVIGVVVDVIIDVAVDESSSSNLFDAKTTRDLVVGYLLVTAAATGVVAVVLACALGAIVVVAM